VKLGAWSKGIQQEQDFFCICTYLSLNLRYDSKLKLFVELVSLLSNAKSDNVSSGFESFSHCWRDPLVPANPLCEFCGTKEWVLLLTDYLLRSIIHGIVAIVNDV